MTRTALIALLLCGCFSEVDVEISPEEYEAFGDPIVVVGEAPGHGDSYRVIYANAEARSYSGAGLYPVGTVIVKEIYRRDGDSMGDFRYIGVMRKLEEAPDGGELDDGWLFTYKGDRDDPAETHRPRCWRTCHQNAPFDGTFLNFSSSAN